MVIALQLLLSILSERNGWKIWVLPWWSAFILIAPEVILAAFLLHGEDPHQLVLVALMGVLNLFAVVAVIGSIASSHENSGGQLLLKGLTVWAANVTAFGIAFWEREYRTDGPEFEFPHKDPGWRPRFFDYFYVSFTNSIAFSPTDAMPLKRSTKLLMLVESAISAVAILLVAARAVNIFK